MLYITGRKSDGVVLERTDFTSPVDMDEYKKNIVINHGGSIEDYSILTIVSSAPEAIKIDAGHPFGVTWLDKEVMATDSKVDVIDPEIYRDEPLGEKEIPQEKSMVMMDKELIGVSITEVFTPVREK